MNPAAVAAELAEVDSLLLEVLSKLERIREASNPGTILQIALQHAQETVALLSEGVEQLVVQHQLSGPENPSFN
jgi:hypothetical protein